jgi:hypothetical protein
LRWKFHNVLAKLEYSLQYQPFHYKISRITVEPCIRVWLDILNYAGEFNKAAAVLKETDFSFWEVDPEGLVPYIKIYKDTYLGVAREELAGRDYPGALTAIGII